MAENCPNLMKVIHLQISKSSMKPKQDKLKENHAQTHCN